MVLTVTPNTTETFNMEATSDNGGTWTTIGSSASLSLNGDIFRVGAGSISCRLDGGASGARGGMQITRSVVVDFDDAGTPAGMVAFWAFTSSILRDTVDTGGITLRIGSDASNWVEWQVATGDGSGGQVYAGGWQRYVVDVSQPPTTTAGTIDWVNVDYFAIQFDVLTDIMGNIPTIWIDEMNHLTATDIANGTSAVTVSGTVDTEGELWREVFDSANNDAEYFVANQGGVFALNQPIEFGATTGTNTFTSKEENCVWLNQIVGDGFQFIRVIGGTGTDTFTWGERVGATNIGSKGTRVLSDGPRWKWISAETDIDTLQLYGCSFDNCLTVDFGTTTTALGTTGDTVHFLGNTLSNCGRITKNIGADTLLEVGNVVSFNNDFKASIDIADLTDINSNEWELVQSSGFIESTANASAETFDTKDFDYSQARIPYINLTDVDETWDVINPTWTIDTSKQKELEFVTAPTVTDDGEINTDVMTTSVGAQRSTVRSSDGVLYMAYANNADNDIEIIKSLDDGTTWSAVLDDANSPTGGTSTQNPTVAIDSTGLIGVLWYDGTVSDNIVFSTFNTATDQWNAGSPATETTVKSTVTVASPQYSLTCDSLNTFHATYWDTTDDTVYYNNSIDWSTNEVSVLATVADPDARVDIAIRPSDDIPLIFICGLVTASNPDVRFYEGNARDATSFTELIVFDAVTDVVSGGAMTCCDDDTVLITYQDETENDYVVVKLATGDASDTPEEVLRFSTEGTTVSSPTITSRNNRIIVAFEDLSDDEIKFYESRNYGVGWSAITSVTTATTSDTPLLRACHGLHEGEPWKLDLTYRDGTDNPQSALIEYSTVNNGDVRELFDVTATAQEPSGTAIATARIKLVEENDKDREIENSLGSTAIDELFSTTQEITCNEFVATNPVKINRITVDLDGDTSTAGTVRAVVITGHVNGQNTGTIRYASSETLNWNDLPSEDKEYTFTFPNPIAISGDILIGLESSGISGTARMRRHSTAIGMDRWRKDDITTGNWSFNVGTGILAYITGIEVTFVDELANEVSTGGSGEVVTTEYLRRLFEPTIEDDLHEHRHENTAFKSYKYGKLPFVTPLGNISTSVNQTATHLPDTFQVETSAGTAITDGETNAIDLHPKSDLTFNPSGNPYLILKYTAGTGTLAVGEQLTQGSANGDVVDIIEGDSTAGTVIIKDWNGTDFDTSTGLTDNGGDWSATITDLGLNSANNAYEFSWLIDANSGATRTMQPIYDYLNAKADEATADTDPPIDEMIVWGRARHGLPIQGTALGSPNLFKTESTQQNIIPEITSANAAANLLDPHRRGNRCNPTYTKQKITGFRILVYKFGTPTGTIVGRVFNDATLLSTDLTTKAVTNETYNVQDMTTNVDGQWIEFTFNEAVEIESPNCVGIEIDYTSTQDGSNNLRIKRNGTSQTTLIHGANWDGVDWAEQTDDQYTIELIYAEEGFCVANLASLGSVDRFRDDNGREFQPQATVTVNTTATSSQTQNTIQGVKVAYYATPKNSGDTPLSSGVTNGSGVYSNSLTLTLPFNMTITARLRGLAPFTVLVTIGAGTTTFDVTAPLGTDNVVDRRE